MQNKKSILILGGTGAMGTFLVDILSNDLNYDVYVTTRQHDKTDYRNIKYIVGNAREREFINELCSNKYNVIVDFMNYNLEEFQDYHNLLLDATDHYLFLSSCRVFSDAPIIDESTTRLLETSEDIEFLKTNRYALRKAREEDILINSEYNNWTIIRPYITYSNRRLQLGVYEKEEWLYRLLNNEPLIIQKGILDKVTTLTYGNDVALGIYNIIKNNTSLGEKINIVTDEYTTWQDILDKYLEVLKRELNIEPKIYYEEDLQDIELLFEGGYNTKYDRLWNRKFKNDKAKYFCGDINYQKVLPGVEKCLVELIKDYKENKPIFREINTEYETKMNNMCKQYIKKKEMIK